MLDIHCPSCQSEHIVKNGHIHNRKQNHLCRDCGRNFVINPNWSPVSQETIRKINLALNERLSLRGICRVFGVAMSWLMKHIKELFASQPADLGAWIPNKSAVLEGFHIAVEADELWGFVGSKANQQWLWLAIERETRQVIAFHIGGRTSQDALLLWEQIPSVYKDHGKFYTDFCSSYEAAIPQVQHRPHGKDAGFTNHIERLNLSIRNRCSRLVRKSICFSKSVKNHIGAIRYFLQTYNHEVLAARF